MIPEYELNAEDVRQMMLGTMEKHLSVRTEGYRSTTVQTFQLLLKAVAEGSSLEAVCADSCGVVDSNTLREQVNRALPVGQLRIQEIRRERHELVHFRHGGIAGLLERQTVSRVAYRRVRILTQHQAE
jgi:hypothetical protein